MNKQSLSSRALASLAVMAALIGMVLTGAAGCSNPNVDTAKVRAVMQGLPPEQMALLDQALTDIDAGKFKEAFIPLRQLGYAAKLTKEQSKVLQETIAKVRAKMAKEQSATSALPKLVIPGASVNLLAEAGVPG